MHGPPGPGGRPEGSQGLGVFGGFSDGMMHIGGPQMIIPGGSRGSKAPKSRKEEEDDTDTYTTIMLRNIPNKYTRGMLIEQLHRTGFRGDIDYLYLPTDFTNRCNVGYCFINLRTPMARARFTSAFDGVAAQSCLPGFNSYKVCQVTKAKWQGREENVRRLRSGPELMAQLAAHPEWLLLLDEEGNQEPFLCDEEAAGMPQGAAVPRRSRGKRQVQLGAAPLMPVGPVEPWQLGINGMANGMPGGAGGRGRGMGDRGGGRRRRGGRGGPHGPGGFADLTSSGGLGVPMAMPVPVMTEQGVQYVPYEAAAAYGAEAPGSYFLAYPTMGPEQQVYGMPYAASYQSFAGGYSWLDGGGGGLEQSALQRQLRTRRRAPSITEALAAAMPERMAEDSMKEVMARQSGDED